ncbi:FHA domain-containing protein, partial [Candidatus Gottesmanbacteria bacterium]|nr:FHA domain-containing protein [Candidatus Gottesmanbacteria bacterium]
MILRLQKFFSSFLPSKFLSKRTNIFTPTCTTSLQKERLVNSGEDFDIYNNSRTRVVRQRGFVQLIPLLLLALFAAVTFTLTYQVQKKQSLTDERSKASEGPYAGCASLCQGNATCIAACNNPQKPIDQITLPVATPTPAMSAATCVSFCQGDPTCIKACDNPITPISSITPPTAEEAYKRNCPSGDLAFCERQLANYGDCMKYGDPGIVCDDFLKATPPPIAQTTPAPTVKYLTYNECIAQGGNRDDCKGLAGDVINTVTIGPDQVNNKNKPLSEKPPIGTLSLGACFLWYTAAECTGQVNQAITPTVPATTTTVPPTPIPTEAVTPVPSIIVDNSECGAFLSRGDTGGFTNCLNEKNKPLITTPSEYDACMSKPGASPDDCRGLKGSRLFVSITPTVTVFPTPTVMQSPGGLISDVLFCVLNPLSTRCLPSIVKVINNFNPTPRITPAITPACFVAGTKIETKYGTRNIELLRAGDDVLSFDAKTGKILESTVAKNFTRLSDHYYELILASGEIVKVTGEHPFYRGSSYRSSFGDMEGGFEKVSRLRVGDMLYRNIDGSLTEDRLVLSVYHGNISIPVYNLSVDGSKTYFAQGIAVHNKDTKKEVADVTITPTPKKGEFSGSYCIGNKFCSGFPPNCSATCQSCDGNGFIPGYASCGYDPLAVIPTPIITPGIGTITPTETQTPTPMLTVNDKCDFFGGKCSQCPSGYTFSLLGSFCNGGSASTVTSASALTDAEKNRKIEEAKYATCVAQYGVNDKVCTKPDGYDANKVQPIAAAITPTITKVPAQREKAYDGGNGKECGFWIWDAAWCGKCSYGSHYEGGVGVCGPASVITPAPVTPAPVAEKPKETPSPVLTGSVGEQYGRCLQAGRTDCDQYKTISNAPITQAPSTPKNTDYTQCVKEGGTKESCGIQYPDPTVTSKPPLSKEIQNYSDCVFFTDGKNCNKYLTPVPTKPTVAPVIPTGQVCIGADCPKTDLICTGPGCPVTPGQICKGSGCSTPTPIPNTDTLKCNKDSCGSTNQGACECGGSLVCDAGFTFDRGNCIPAGDDGKPKSPGCTSNSQCGGGEICQWNYCQEKPKETPAPGAATPAPALAKSGGLLLNDFVPGQTIASMCNSGKPGWNCTTREDWERGYNEARKKENFGVKAVTKEFTDTIKDLDNDPKNGLQVGEIVYDDFNKQFVVKNGFTVDLKGTTEKERLDEIYVQKKKIELAEDLGNITVNKDGTIAYANPPKAGLPPQCDPKTDPNCVQLLKQCDPAVDKDCKLKTGSSELMSKEEYLSFKLAKSPTNLKVGDPGCIICDSCGGFCADPNGGGCNAQAENLCPRWVESGKKLLSDGVLAISCYNPDKSPCVGGLYGVKEGVKKGTTEVLVDAVQYKSLTGKELLTSDGLCAETGKAPTYGSCFIPAASQTFAQVNKELADGKNVTTFKDVGSTIAFALKETKVKQDVYQAAVKAQDELDRSSTADAASREKALQEAYGKLKNIGPELEKDFLAQVELQRVVRLGVECDTHWVEYKCTTLANRKNGLSSDAKKIYEEQVALSRDQRDAQFVYTRDQVIKDLEAQKRYLEGIGASKEKIQEIVKQIADADDIRRSTIARLSKNGQDILAGFVKTQATFDVYKDVITGDSHDRSAKQKIYKEQYDKLTDDQKESFTFLSENYFKETLVSQALAQRKRLTEDGILPKEKQLTADEKKTMQALLEQNEARIKSDSALASVYSAESAKQRVFLSDDVLREDCIARYGQGTKLCDAKNVDTYRNGIVTEVLPADRDAVLAEIKKQDEAKAAFKGSNIGKAFDDYKTAAGAGVTVSFEDFQKKQEEAYNRIQDDLKALGVLDDKYLAKIKSGEYVPTEIEKALEIQKKDWFANSVLTVNKWTGGATKRGNEILLSGAEKWKQGDYINGYSDVVRGALIQGAGPAAVVAGAVGLVVGGVMLAPIIAAVGTIGMPAVLGSVLTVSGTGFGYYATVHSLQELGEACAPDTLGTTRCGDSAKFTAFSAASTVVGTFAGAGQFAAQKGIADAINSGGNAAKVAEAVNAAKSLNIAGVSTAGKALEWSNRGVAAGGVLIFGEQAARSCLGEERNALSCGLNTGMMLVSAVRLGNSFIKPNPAGLAIKGADVADVAVNSAQAAVACTIGLAQDAGGCANAIAGAALSAGGLAHTFSGAHANKPIQAVDTSTVKLETARATLETIAKNPSATATDKAAAKTALASNINARAQELASTQIALQEKIGGKATDHTQGQKDLLTRQEEYAKAKSLFDAKVKEVGLAAALKDSTFIAHQQATDTLIASKQYYDAEKALLNNPRWKISQAIDPLRDPKTVEAYNKAKEEYLAVARSDTPNEVKFKEAVEKLQTTRNQLEAVGYSKQQHEYTATLSEQQKKLEAATKEYLGLREEVELLGEPGKIVAAQNEAALKHRTAVQELEALKASGDVKLENGKWTNAKGEEVAHSYIDDTYVFENGQWKAKDAQGKFTKPVDASEVVAEQNRRYASRKITLETEIPTLAVRVKSLTDLQSKLAQAENDPIARRELDLKKQRFGELQIEYAETQKEMQRLAAAKEKAGTITGRLSNAIFGTEKHPSFIAERIIGNISDVSKEIKIAVAQEVGKELLGSIFDTAEAKVRAASSQGKTLTTEEAVRETLREVGKGKTLLGQGDLYNEALTSAKDMLKARGMTDERVINRQADEIARSVASQITAKTNDIVATAVLGGRELASAIDFSVKAGGLSGTVQRMAQSTNPVARSVYGVGAAIADGVHEFQIRTKSAVEVKAEYKGTLDKLAKLQKERGGLSLLDEGKVKVNGKEVQVEAVVKVTQETVKENNQPKKIIVNGKEVEQKTTKFSFTDKDAAAKIGLSDTDLKVLNDTVGAYEEWASSLFGKSITIRSNTGNYFDQAKFVLASVETFARRGNRGAIFEALPGVGKTEIIMGLNVLLQARMTNDPQIVVAPNKPLMEQFLKTNNAYVDLLKAQLGEGSVIVFDPSDPLSHPTSEQIKKAKVIITMRDVAFTLREVDTPVGRSMRDKWRQAYVHGDESHWTFNPFENFQVSFGNAQRTIDTPEGKGYLAAKDKVKNLTKIQEMIKARKENRVPDGIEKTVDGRGKYTDTAELEILQEWMKSRQAEGTLPRELIPLLSETKVDVLRSKLNSYTNTNYSEGGMQMRQELSVINHIGDVLSSVPGLSFGPEAPGGIISPREFERITGRRFQGIGEQIVYNTIGADIVGATVKLSDLTVSTQSRDINYALLLSEAKGHNHYTGTPSQIERFYKLGYGTQTVNTDKGGSAIETTNARFKKGFESAGKEAQIFGSLGEQKAARGNELVEVTLENGSVVKRKQSRVYVNVNDAQSNTLALEQVAKIEEGAILFKIGANGEYIEGKVVSGKFEVVNEFRDGAVFDPKTKEPLSARDQMNFRTAELDVTGQDYAKFHEIGAHTGVDTKTPVLSKDGKVIARVIPIVGDNTDSTTFAQGAQRLRADVSPDSTKITQGDMDVVYLGKAKAPTTPEELFTRLEVNEQANLARGEVLFKETFLRNSVDMLLDRVITEAKKPGWLGIGKPDDVLIGKLTNLEQSWKATKDLNYVLGDNPVKAEAKLQATLERVKALIAQVDQVVSTNPRVASTFDQFAKGYEKTKIGFSSTEAEVTLSSNMKFRDIVDWVNKTSTNERLGKVDFTERGPSAQVVTAESIKAANAPIEIPTNDVPVSGQPQVVPPAGKTPSQKIADAEIVKGKIEAARASGVSAVITSAERAALVFGIAAARTAHVASALGVSGSEKAEERAKKAAVAQAFMELTVDGKAAELPVSGKVTFVYTLSGTPYEGTYPYVDAEELKTLLGQKNEEMKKGNVPTYEIRATDVSGTVVSLTATSTTSVADAQNKTEVPTHLRIAAEEATKNVAHQKAVQDQLKAEAEALVQSHILDIRARLQDALSPATTVTDDMVQHLADFENKVQVISQDKNISYGEAMKEQEIKAAYNLVASSIIAGRDGTTVESIIRSIVEPVILAARPQAEAKPVTAPVDAGASKAKPAAKPAAAKGARIIPFVKWSGDLEAEKPGQELFANRSGVLGYFGNATPFGIGRGGNIWNGGYAFTREGWKETGAWFVTRTFGFLISWPWDAFRIFNWAIVYGSTWNQNNAPKIDDIITAAEKAVRDLEGEAKSATEKRVEAEGLLVAAQVKHALENNQVAEKDALKNFEEAKIAEAEALKKKLSAKADLDAINDKIEAINGKIEAESASGLAQDEGVSGFETFGKTTVVIPKGRNEIVHIGRDAGAELPLWNIDMSVSRKHLEVWFENNEYRVKDISRHKNTYILRGGKPVKLEGNYTVLLSQDVIVIGDIGGRVQFDGTSLSGPNYQKADELSAVDEQKVRNVLASKRFTDTASLRVLRDELEGIIFENDSLDSAKSLIRSQLQAALESAGLNTPEAAKAYDELSKRLDIAKVIDDHKKRLAELESGRGKTIHVDDLKKLQKPGKRLSQSSVQKYDNEYVSNSGQKLKIDTKNDEDLRRLVDSAVRWIAAKREQTKDVKSGAYTLSRLDALSDWAKTQIAYSKKRQQSVYFEGNGEAQLGSFKDGGVCREKTFLIDLVARRLYLQSEVLIFEFNDKGRHAVNYFPERGLIVDGTNFSKAMTIDEYEATNFVKNEGRGINWLSKKEYANSASLSEAEFAKRSVAPKTPAKIVDQIKIDALINDRNALIEQQKLALAVLIEKRESHRLALEDLSKQEVLYEQFTKAIASLKRLEIEVEKAKNREAEMNRKRDEAKEKVLALQAWAKAWKRLLELEPSASAGIKNFDIAGETDISADTERMEKVIKRLEEAEAAKPAAAPSTKDLDAARKLRDEAKTKHESAQKLAADALGAVEAAKKLPITGGAVSPKDLQDAKEAVETAEKTFTDARNTAAAARTEVQTVASALASLEARRTELDQELAGKAPVVGGKKQITYEYDTNLGYHVIMESGNDFTVNQSFLDADISSLSPKKMDDIKPFPTLPTEIVTYKNSTEVIVKGDAIEAGVTGIPSVNGKYPGVVLGYSYKASGGNQYIWVFFEVNGQGYVRELQVHRYIDFKYHNGKDNSAQLRIDLDKLDQEILTQTGIRDSRTKEAANIEATLVGMNEHVQGLRTSYNELLAKAPAAQTLSEAETKLEAATKAEKALKAALEVEEEKVRKLKEKQSSSGGKIGDVVRIDNKSFGEPLYRKSEIPALVDQPLIKGTEIFWDKNILSLDSGANVKNSQSQADFSIDVSTMSDENKQIAQQLVSGGKATLSDTGKTLTFTMPITADTPIATVESWLVEIANQFKIQPLTWPHHQGMTYEEYAKDIIHDEAVTPTADGLRAQGYYVDERVVGRPIVYFSQEIFEKITKPLEEQERALKLAETKPAGSSVTVPSSVPEELKDVFGRLKAVVAGKVSDEELAKETVLLKQLKQYEDAAKKVLLEMSLDEIQGQQNASTLNQNEYVDIAREVVI